VVGVVTDTRYRSLREPYQPIFYGAFSEKANNERFGFQVEVRTWGRPESVIASMRALMRRIEPNLPFREVRTLAEDVDDSLWAERALAGTGTIFSTMAALVACVGLYGLLSYAVAQRRREIGIRMALGARPAEIARGALVRVLGLVAAGAAVGSAVALWTGRFLSSILYEVQPGDGRAILAAWVLVMLTAAIAAWGTAWRAARVNPSDALRG
jgi:ABC-type antimicrobial peptide transport system permease subunit